LHYCHYFLRRHYFAAIAADMPLIIIAIRFRCFSFAYFITIDAASPLIIVDY